MKAVVMEVRGKRAAALKDDGTMVNIKNKDFSQGDIIMVKEPKQVMRTRFAAIIAVAAVFLVMMSAGVWAYVTPQYHISLDVNPGMVLEVNRFERVIGVDPVNEEAETVLEGLNLNNQRIDDAISRAIARFVDAGYFSEDDQNVAITSSSQNDERANQLTERLRNVIDTEVGKYGVTAEIRSGVTGHEMVQEAKDLGITPGRLNIITNLLGEDPDDENMGAPIKDLMKRFTEDKGAHGRARAEAAGGSPRSDADEDDENEASSENADLGPDNAKRKADEANDQEDNAAAETPAGDKKAPEADAQEDNVTEKKPETPNDDEPLDEDNGPSDRPGKPDDVPVGGRP